MRAIFILLTVFAMIHPLVALGAGEALGEFASLRVWLATPSATQITQGEVPVLLDMRLQKGWKTYWRTPGSAGMPLTITSEGSTNIKEVQLHWPAPTRYVEPWGSEVWGYAGGVGFPVTVVREQPKRDSQLKLLLQYSVCSDICVPYEQSIDITLPAVVTADSGADALLKKYMQRVPKANKQSGLTIGTLRRISEKNGKGILKLDVYSTTPFKTPDIFVEAGADIAFSRPHINYSADDRTAHIRLEYVLPAPDATLTGRPVMLTLTEAGRAVEKQLLFSAPQE